MLPFLNLKAHSSLFQSALFQAIAAINIITDIALVVLPCVLLRNVQLSRWKRFRIMALIASKVM